MLSNTLSIIGIVIQKRLRDRTNDKEIIEFFQNYKKDMWIYPGILKRKFSLSIEEVYDVLNDLEEKGILESYYEIFCGICQKSIGIVHLFNELPETVECEICHGEIPALENSLLIYKVIRDD